MPAGSVAAWVCAVLLFLIFLAEVGVIGHAAR